MAYMIDDKLWRSEFCNNVSAKDIVQDINLDQLKLKVNDIYKKDEKTAANFEQSNDEDVVNKTYPDTEFFKVEGYISFLEKD